MFGCVVADVSRLSEEQLGRYKGCYCGLCRSLGKCHGVCSKLCLNYDMTFLILLLSSLYEPEEEAGSARCLVHPRKKRDFWSTRFSNYAASMNVLLAWHKCRDDWQDEKKLFRLVYSWLLSPAAKDAKAQYPRQAAAIDGSMAALSRLEAENAGADVLAAEFGNLMGELFVYEEGSYFASTLRAFGQKLGRFIYVLDAVCDLEEDKKRHRFNPLLDFGEEGPHSLPHLQLLMGDAAAEFEKLPLVQDVDLLRNILYSGVWSQYDRQFTEKEAAP